MGRNLCFSFSFLALFSLLMTNHTLEVQAQTSTSWLSKITGNYRSQIWNDDGLIPTTTQFKLTSNGSLIGSYKMNEQGKLVPGSLSQCQALRLLVVQCVWNDKYGTGELEMTFSQDFSSFDGVWSANGSLDRYIWIGSR